MKLRLYVLLELLLESTCKIAWDKRKVNNVLQYYFLYCLCFFSLEPNLCSLYSNISWYNSPTLTQVRDKEFTRHCIFVLFCFHSIHLDFNWDCSFFFFFLGQAMLLVRSYFPDQGSNLCPAVGSPNTGLPRNSRDCSFLRVLTQCRVLNSTTLFVLVVGLVSCPLWQPF